MDSYLEHHGILGQKWGVRRFQNEDGTLTSEGRIRYGAGSERESHNDSGGPKSKTKALLAIENDAKNYSTPKEKLKAVTADCWTPLGSEHPYRDYMSDKNGDKKRCDAAADLGIDACEKLSGPGYIDFDEYEGSNTKQLNRNWFLFEDQTIGFPIIADLINQGYTAEQCSKMVGIVRREYANASDYSINPVVDEIVNGYQLEEFAKCCEEVKNSKGLNHSEATNLVSYDELVHSLFSDDEDDHLEHHGILGMKWYRRRFQNEDGSLTPAGRERYGVGEAREGSGDKPKKPGLIERHKQKKEEKRKAVEKAARVKRMQEGKARKAAEKKEAEEHEAAKQKALTSGKATEVLKFRDELTNNEIRDALSRVEWEKSLRKNAREENPDAIDRAMKVLDKYGGYAKTVGDATGNFANAYNNIAKVMNTFTGSDWPLIDKKMTRNERIRDEEATKQAQLKTQSDAERLIQDREITKQSYEETKQKREATIQAEEASVQSKQKTMQGAEDISQASERTKQAREKTSQEAEYTKQERYKTTQESERSKQEQYKTAQESERHKQEEERTTQQRENTTQARQRTMYGAEGVSQASERTKQERYKTTQEKYKAEQERQKAEQAKRTADSWTSSKSYTDIVSRPMDSSSSEEAQKTGEHWVFNSSYLPLGLPDKRKRLTDSKG